MAVDVLQVDDAIKAVQLCDSVVRYLKLERRYRYNTVSGIEILDTILPWYWKCPVQFHLVQNSPVLILGLEVCRPVKSRLYCEL